MKCEECESLVDDYAYGELDDRASAEAAAHISGCAACSNLYEQARRELEMFMRYEREVEVTPELWAAVEARIKEEKATHHKSWLARSGERFTEMFRAPRLSPAFAAAIVVVAIGITVAVTTFINSRNANQSGGQIAAENTNSNAQPHVAQSNQNVNAPQHQQGDGTGNKEEVASGKSENDRGAENTEKSKTVSAPRQQLANAKPADADQLVREAEQKYLAAINILQRDVKKSKLDPATRARFEVALAEIDRTIAETRQVARRNPGDATAAQYLLGAYSKKVDVLREMSRESATEDQ